MMSSKESLKKITFSKRHFGSSECKYLIPVISHCFVDSPSRLDSFKGQLFDEMSISEKQEVEQRVLACYLENIPKFTKRLNKINKISKSEEYWSIAIGHWLIFAIQFVMVRAHIVTKLISSFAEDEVEWEGISLDQSGIYFASTEELVSKISFDDDFNTYVFSELLKKLAPPNWQEDEHKIAWHKGGQAYEKSKFNRLRFESFTGVYGLNILQKLFFSFINRLFFVLGRSSTQKYFSTLDEIKKCVKKEFLDEKQLSIDCFLDLMMPKNFLDIKNIKRPKTRFLTPNLIDSGGKMYGNDEYAFYVADLLECGRKAAFAQHGGLYGSSQIFTAPFVRELVHSDFLSWGWEHFERYKMSCTAVPSPYVYKFFKSRRKVKVQDKIVFVGTRLPSYYYNLYGMPTGKRNVEISRRRVTLFESLKPKLQAKCKYKPYPHNEGDFKDLFHSSHVASQISLVKTDALEEVKDAKLVVVDHPITTFLMCLAARIPVIGIWSKDEWEMNGKLVSQVEKLRDCGFIHESAESAAAWICENYDEIEEKFTSIEVVDEIVKEYAMVDRLWFYKLCKFIWKFHRY